MLGYLSAWSRSMFILLIQGRVKGVLISYPACGSTPERVRLWVPLTHRAPAASVLSRCMSAAEVEKSIKVMCPVEAQVTQGLLAITAEIEE